MSSEEERFRRRSRKDDFQRSSENESPKNNESNEQNEEGQTEEQRQEEDEQREVLDDTCAQMVPLETLKQNYNEALKPLVYAMKEMTQSVKNLKQGESHRRRKRRVSSSSESSRSRSHRRKRERHTYSRSRSFERCSSHDRRSKDKWSTDEEMEDVFEGEEKTGRDLRRETKYITDKYFSKKLTHDSLQKRIQKHPRPGNCSKLKTPKTNDEVWSKLKASEKSMDLKIKNTQKMLTASTTALAKGIDKKSGTNSLFEDALVLLGQAHLQLSSIRKDLHRKNLSYSLKELQELENNEDFLYGEDGKLKKKIKELEREAKEEKKKPFLGQYQRRRNFYQNQSYKKYSSQYPKHTQNQKKSYQNQKQRKKFQA